MNLFSWNVNGLRSVLAKGKFLPFLKQHQPDILCLQETKAAREQVEIDLPGYHEYWNSAAKPGYSGTAVFSRTEPIAVTLGFPKPIARKYSMLEAVGRDAANEGRVITAEFPRFYVVNVYVPNTKPDLSRLAFRHQRRGLAFLAHWQRFRKEEVRDELH